MAFIPTPQGVQVKIIGTLGSQPCVNVFHVDAGASPSETILDDINSIFENWLTTDLLPNLSTTYVVNEIQSTDISVEDGIQRSIVLTSGNTGGQSGSNVPANAALCVSFRTSRTGRSYRGRAYVGGLAAAGIADNQHVTTLYAGQTATFFVYLRSALETAGYTLSVLSKVLNKVARVTGVLTEIVTIVVNTNIDSQRRRNAN